MDPFNKQFYCEICRFKGRTKTQYEEHIRRPKHKKNVADYEKSLSENQNLQGDDMYILVKSLSKAVKDMNDKIEEKDAMIQKLKKRLDVLESKSSQIMNINTNGTNNVTINNGPVHQHINYNVQLVPYSQAQFPPETSHMEIVGLLKGVNRLPQEWVKKIYFNPNHPEQQCIRIPNCRVNKTKVFTGKIWETVPTRQITVNLASRVDEWIDDHENVWSEFGEFYIKKIKELQRVFQDGPLNDDNTVEVSKNTRATFDQWLRKIAGVISDYQQICPNYRKLKV